MKSYLYLALFLTACSGASESRPVANGTPDALDTENGFRGVQFGSTPEGLKNATVQYQKGSLATYEQDNHTVAGDSISEMIYYDYGKGGLVSIYYGGANSRIQPILAEMRKKYGPERTSNDTMYWEGKRVGAWAFIQQSSPELTLLTVKLYQR